MENAIKKRVVFFRHDAMTDNTIAVFPFEGKSNGTCLYTDIQHTNKIDFTEAVLTHTKAATDKQCEFLYRQLKGEGYNLIVINLSDKATIEYRRNPTTEEIKFGYGDTHYIDVPIMSVLNKDGNLKKQYIFEGVKYIR